MSRSLWAVFLAAIFGIMSLSFQKVLSCIGEGDQLVRVGGEVSANTSGTFSVKLSDLPVGKVIQVGQIKFVKVGADQYLAINLCPDGSTYQAEYKGCVVKTTNFTYTGGEQIFTAPTDDYYLLEVWGAQGGQHGSPGTGGYGGYATGIIQLSANEYLSIYIGQQGGYISTYAYNGGGIADYGAASGGGATHMSLNTKRGVLYNYSSYQSEVVIVAGGGGGADNVVGANGGGYKGQIGNSYAPLDPKNGYTAPTEGTQTSPGTNGASTYSTSTGNATFGRGGWGKNNTDYGGGGGGGWYGGGGAVRAGGGAGGSGYINHSRLTNKHMYCHNCGTTQTDTSFATTVGTCVNSTPTTDCAKSGPGAARITQMTVYLGI